MDVFIASCGENQAKDSALRNVVHRYCEREAGQVRNQATLLAKGITDGGNGDLRSPGVANNMYRAFLMCAEAHGAPADLEHAFDRESGSLLSLWITDEKSIKAAATGYADLARLFEQANAGEVIE